MHAHNFSLMSFLGQIMTIMKNNVAKGRHLRTHVHAQSQLFHFQPQRRTHSACRASVQLWGGTGRNRKGKSSENERRSRCFCGVELRLAGRAKEV